MSRRDEAIVVSALLVQKLRFTEVGIRLLFISEVSLDPRVPRTVSLVTESAPSKPFNKA